MDKPSLNGNRDLVLRDGSRIAVVGAGPAGCFFAHFALDLARSRGLNLRLTLYDGRSFAREGPVGCNMCAGVLAATLVEKLHQIGVDLPPQVVQRRVDRYRLVTPLGEVSLDSPEGSGPIVTVYRGNGPRGSGLGAGVGGNVSFDNHLLLHALSMGAEHAAETVGGLTMPAVPGEPVRLQLASGTVHEADLVVGAFGVHSPLARILTQTLPAYVPPPSTRAFQVEIELGEAEVDRRYGNAVHVFSLALEGISFAALTPKRSYVTASLVGEGAGPQTMEAFLAHPLVRKCLPAAWTLSAPHCQCRPRLPIGPARQPFADRVVMVGDASISRLYKNGLESAFVTARAAAETAVLHGISADAFHQHYVPVCRDIARDSAAGRRLFWMKDNVFERRPLAAMLVRAAREEQQLDAPADRLIGRALWGVFTGDQAYREILRNVLQPRVQAHFWRRGLPALWSRTPDDPGSRCTEVADGQH